MRESHAVILLSYMSPDDSNGRMHQGHSSSSSETFNTVMYSKNPKWHLRPLIGGDALDNHFVMETESCNCAQNIHHSGSAPCNCEIACITNPGFNWEPVAQRWDTEEGVTPSLRRSTLIPETSGLG